MGGMKVNKLTKKFCASMLGLMLLFAVASSASAQSFGGRMSNGKKAGIIGGGAAAGAVIGGLLGGKKGAIIGGLLGAGGGSAYVYANGRDDDRYRGYRGYNGYRYYGNDRRWETSRFDNNRWDRDRDHDRDDRGRNRWNDNRFRH
jgi:hypothetical protein